MQNLGKSISVLDKVTARGARWTQPKDSLGELVQCLTESRAVLTPYGENSGRLEGSALSFTKATAHIRSQTCSLVLHFGTQGLSHSPVTLPIEVAVSGPRTPHPKGGAESGST